MVRGQWWEAHTGERFRITTYGMGGEGVVRVKTYGEVIEAYRVHEEAKSVGPDGEPCGKKTRGLLGRRDVSMLTVPKYVGKETNKLEERMREEVAREDAFLNVYEDRLCACECGEPVTGRQRYVDSAHKQRAYRLRSSRER